MAVTIKGFASDWSVPEPAKAGIGAAAVPQILEATSSALSLPGRRWAFLGDSITNGSSAANFSYSYSSMAVEQAGSLVASSSFIESGVPGQRIQQMADRVEATLDAGAEGLVVLAGTNDAGRTDIPNATPLAEYQAAYQTIVTAAKRRGIPVVVCTVPPRGETPPEYTRAAIEQYNTWLRLWAPGAGCYVAETWGALVDPTTGDLAADTFAAGDGTHPTNVGHYRMAKAVAKALREASRGNLGLSMVHAKTPGSLAPNPLMTGTGPRPAGFYEQPGGTGTAPVYSLVEDTYGFLPAGRWAQIDFDGTVSGGNRNMAVGLSSTGWAVGDRIAVTGVIEVEDVSGTWEAQAVAGAANVRALILNQSAVNIKSSWARNVGRKRAGTNVYELGPYLSALTVPAGTTGLMIWLNVQVPTGHHYRVRFGATDVINLTARGVSGIEPGIVNVPA